MFKKLTNTFLKNEKSLKGREIKQDEERDKSEIEIESYCETTDSSFEEVRHFINKIVAWYELKYSSERIQSMVWPHSDSYEGSIFDNIEIKEFIKTLDDWDKDYLRKPRYQSFFTLNRIKCPNGLMTDPRFELSKRGTITDVSARGFEEYVGMSIRSLPYQLDIDNFQLSEANEKAIDEVIDAYDQEFYARIQLLDIIASEIIEHAETRVYGIIRAIEFAKDFGFAYDILLDNNRSYMAGDRTLTRVLINEYTKACAQEGSDVNFQSQYGEQAMADMRYELKKSRYYTTEEHELHERLATALLQGIDMGKLEEEARAERDEEVKRFRIERKIDQSH